MRTESGPVGRLLKGREVHIIGAGISGLLMAYYLKKAGHKVTIFEKGLIGGKIQTKQTDGGLAETAANAIFSSPEAMELIAELELVPLYPAKNLKKKIWRFNRAMRFPLLPWEFARLFLSLYKTPPQKKDMSITDFFGPLLGEKTARELLSAVFAGVYAAHSDRLDFHSVFKVPIGSGNYFQFFKTLFKAKKSSSHRAKSVSFKNGMSDFIGALESKLQSDIVRSEYFEIDPKANTVFCCESFEAARILDTVTPEVSKALKEIEYVPLTTVTYFFKRPIDQLKDTFGILITPDSKLKAIGILHNNAIFTDRTKSNQLESYTFISCSEDYSQKDALKDASFLSKKVFDQSDILASKQTHWAKGIPLYDAKRKKAISRARAYLNDQAGIVLFGNYVDGISIREMIKSAKNYASISI